MKASAKLNKKPELPKTSWGQKVPVSAVPRKYTQIVLFCEQGMWIENPKNPYISMGFSELSRYPQS